MDDVVAPATLRSVGAIDTFVFGATLLTNLRWQQQRLLTKP